LIDAMSGVRLVPVVACPAGPGPRARALPVPLHADHPDLLPLVGLVEPASLQAVVLAQRPKVAQPRPARPRDLAPLALLVAGAC
jgi:hypothetical protein